MANEIKKNVRSTNVPLDAVRSTADVEIVQSDDRTLAIVELLLRTLALLTVREVAAGTGINRTMAHRLLASIRRRGWIEPSAESAAYRPGLRYLALMRASLHGRDFVDEVRPTMDLLSLLSRETVHLGVLDNQDVLPIEKVDSPETVRVSSRVGTRAAPHVTGLGKSLLASASDEELAVYIEHAQKDSSPPLLVDPHAFRADIALARRGYSIDDGESSPGVRCLVVPICGVGGSPHFALSLTGPSGRCTKVRMESCVPEMIVVARDLTTQFGGEVPRFRGGRVRLRRARKRKGDRW